MSVHDKLDAFGLHLRDTAIDQMLLHLEMRDAVAQQPANAIGLFKYSDRMPGARKLLRRSQTRGTRSHNCHPFASFELRGFRENPAFGPGPVDDRFLDVLNRHRRFTDAQHAGGLAGRGDKSSP